MGAEIQAAAASCACASASAASVLAKPAFDYKPAGRYPPRMLVVYDADCGVCQASVAWIRKRDRRRVFQFLGNDVAELPPGISHEETEHTLIVLDGARKLVRADGVARILRE